MFGRNHSENSVFSAFNISVPRVFGSNCELRIKKHGARTQMKPVLFDICRSANQVRTASNPKSTTVNQLGAMSYEHGAGSMQETSTANQRGAMSYERGAGVFHGSSRIHAIGGHHEILQTHENNAVQENDRLLCNSSNGDSAMTTNRFPSAFEFRVFRGFYLISQVSAFTLSAQPDHLNLGQNI